MSAIISGSHRWIRILPVALCFAGAGTPYADQPVHPHDVVVRDGSAEPIVAVHHEPHHRQVFQRGPVRVLDLQVPPGDRSWFHTHDWPVFYLTLSTSGVRIQNLGQDWGGGGGRAPAGGTPTPPLAEPRVSSTTSYAEQPIIHRLENIGERLFRAMVVVNESPGSETATPAEAGFHREPALANRWFRAYRGTIEPGETTGVRERAAPVVVFQATPGSGLGLGAVTFEFNDPGQWAYFEPGDAYELRNIGDAPMEFVEVEVRLP